MNKQTLPTSNKSIRKAIRKSKSSSLQAIDLLVPADVFSLEPVIVAVPNAEWGGSSYYTIVA